MSQHHYTQLSRDERVIIASEVQYALKMDEKPSLGRIADKLGRSRSTIWRELNRNGSPPDAKTTRVNKPRQDGRHYRGSIKAEKIIAAKGRYEKRRQHFIYHSRLRYNADTAHQKSLRRKKKAMRAAHPLKLVRGAHLANYVEAKLLLDWSPEQISLRLRLLSGNNIIVSYNAIYRYIYALPGDDKRKFIQHLRRRGHRPRRKRIDGPFNATDRTGHSIHDRPAAVDALVRLGDLEGDTIVGKDPRDRLLTHVDRITGLTSISRILNFNADKVARQTKQDVERVFNGNGTSPKTATYDNGVEFTFWQQTEKLTGMQIYFADPYSPNQRGRNENTNALIRWYFGKGTDFKEITEADIMRVEFLLNNRPRKHLGGLTPLEAYVALNL